MNIYTDSWNSFARIYTSTNLLIKMYKNEMWYLMVQSIQKLKVNEIQLFVWPKCLHILRTIQYLWGSWARCIINFWLQKCCDPLMAMYIKNYSPHFFDLYFWLYLVEKSTGPLPLCTGPHYPINIDHPPDILHLNRLPYCQQHSWNLLKNERIFCKQTLW